MASDKMDYKLKYHVPAGVRSNTGYTRCRYGVE